jgi:hypothetical protein
MSRDHLEKYILEHRAQFDDQEPDPALWGKIGKPEGRVVRLNWRKIAWQAAAAVALFVASYFFHDYMAGTQTGSDPAFLAAEPGEEGSPIVRELIEAEAYYTSQINLRKDEVFSLTAAYPEVQQEISLELGEMDKVFEELKEDLRDNAANEEVIEAMIQNYRLKLDILEEMLYRLKQARQPQKDEENESTRMEL